MSNETEQGSGSVAAETNGNEVQSSEELQTETQGAETAPAQSGEHRSTSDSDATQRTLSKMAYQLRQARRENAELRQRYESGGDYNDSRQDRDQEAPPLKSLADFDYDEHRYNEYMFGEFEKRMDRRLETKLEKQFNQRETQQQMWQRYSKFAQSEREFAKKTPDYFDVTRDDALPFTETVRDLLATSDIGPDLTYHLAKNEALLFEIADMDERSAARVIGQLEERIQASRKAPPGRTTTRAPAPAARLDATDEALEKEDSEQSDEEWLARRRKEVHSRGL